MEDETQAVSRQNTVLYTFLNITSPLDIDAATSTRVRVFMTVPLLIEAFQRQAEIECLFIWAVASEMVVLCAKSVRYMSQTDYTDKALYLNCCKGSRVSLCIVRVTSG